MSEKHCDMITFEPKAQKSCRNPVVRDGLCEEHHPTLRAERDAARTRFTAGLSTEALEGTTLAEFQRLAAMAADTNTSRATLYHEGRALLSKLGDGQ